MVRKITKDLEILSQKSENFIPGLDDHLITDMLDTANAHKDNCAGLACIQIGVPKRIILVRSGDGFMVFCNPAIVKRSAKTYMATEGCLSLDGSREVKRHNSVMVSWVTPKGKRNVREFTGWIAEILQHEIDHCNGILI
jgi:peptide deformylase